MTPIPQDKLTELETTYGGKIRIFQHPDGPEEWQLVLRKPNGREFQSFRLAANSDAKKPFAALDVIRATAVWPPPNEFKEVLEEFGLLPEGITSSKAWKDWIGLEVAGDAKK